MPKPPRRARFQMHLSTAILMMFVAGGLVWVNVRQRDGMTIFHLGTNANPEYTFIIGNEESYVHGLKGEYWGGFKGYCYGWPCNIRSFPDKLMAEKTFNQKSIRVLYSDLHHQAIIINAIIGAAVLIAMWFLCEWLIRRRAARKSN